MGLPDGYAKWPSNTKIPLTLTLTDAFGDGVTGAIPECSIRRYRETFGGPLDNYFWDGSTGFVTTPTYFPLTEVDSVNNPGLYTYTFNQDLVGLEYVYLVYFRNSTPKKVVVETHIVTNEIYIPRTQPDPVIMGPTSVLEQLQLIKDGGTELFNPEQDSLHYLRLDAARILGLLHQNAMVDRQLYGPHGMLTSARLRVFESPSYIPSVPGGVETLGLTQEYAIEAAYQGTGETAVLSKYLLRRVR
jgi:hypothetical protein